MKPWLHSWTLWFNVAVIVAAVVIDQSTVYVNPLVFVLVCAAGNLVVDGWEWRRR